MEIIRKTQNGAVKKPVQPTVRGRDIADNAIRLRVYLATELRRQAQDAGLDPEHWGPAAVTALTISLERQGVRGIPISWGCETSDFDSDVK